MWELGRNETLLLLLLLLCRTAASEVHLNGQQQQQQRSCSDLSGVNYPGDLLSDAPRARPRRAVPPPLVKRNTVADFANTKAYQASTASLISASEQGAPPAR